MYPWDPGQALHDALLFSEEQYKKENVIKQDNKVYIKDKSGSCALVCIVMNDKIFVANIGDSRAIMSMDGGKKVI